MTLDTPPLIASRYRVLRELGRGGMGVVYVVEHTRTGDQVALKLLYGQAARDPQAIERFRREARASGRIKSEHVVKVIDADVAPELENAPFLVMELLNGTDLEKQIETRGRMAPHDALQYLSQAARGLDKSHSMGIVHRDLKPENLFVHHREDGTTVLKILDFGISKVVGGDAAGDITGAKMTSTGAIMGTPLYMAPEQARGRVSEIGPATDVWATGLIALFLLTGEVYWRANTIAELMAQILSEPLYPPTQRWSWLPAGIDAWFAQSCARDPKQRFTSVGQQIEALGAVFGLRASAVPSADASAPWGAVPSAAVSAASPLLGANTTGATARTANQAAATGTGKRRMPMVVAATAVVVLAGAGTTAWVVRGRMAAAHATSDPAAVSLSASAAAVVPAISASPPSAVPAPPPAETLAAVAPAPAASAVADAGSATAAPSHHASGAGRAAPAPHPALAAQPQPKTQPQPAPAPAPRPTAAPGTFNPAAP